MAYFVLVVEGAHDAAFFGILLRRRGFNKVDNRAAVDPFWERLIPTQFPANPDGRLDHVVKYPDIYEKKNGFDRASVAIVVAAGESKLVSEFQATLEILDLTQLRAAGIISDADEIGADARMQSIRQSLEVVSAEAARNLVPGFPLTLPNAAGWSDAALKIGIHVFPNNKDKGTLETILLDCARTSYADFLTPAADFVKVVDGLRPAGSAELRLLRKGSGRDKATAASIGSVLFPGCSLAVAIDRGSWLEPTIGNEEGLLAAEALLASMLA